MAFKNKFRGLFVAGMIVFSFASSPASVYAMAAEEQAELPITVTLEKVNFRVGPSVYTDVIKVIKGGVEVNVIEVVNEITDGKGWCKVQFGDATGYIKAEYIGTEAEYEKSLLAKVQLTPWSEAKNIFTIGVPAEVYDIYTGLTYYVKSFSNGNHADVEPVTKEDTAIMYQTFNYHWKWDPRPVWVTINGVTMAASINGMPHGGGVNNDNGMDGQVCIHFKGSTTHNGNGSFAKEHQDALMEAWYAAQ